MDMFSQIDDQIKDQIQLFDQRIHETVSNFENNIDNLKKNIDETKIDQENALKKCEE